MARMQPATKLIYNELEQARQAAAFYSKRVEDLKDVLETLDEIDAPATRSRSRGARKSIKATKSIANAQKAGVKGHRSTKLPSTGKDFWLSLLSDTPQSSAQIFKAALAALRIRPAPEDRKKLSQRMANALSVLTKDSKIIAEGERRTKLYSINSASAA